MRLKHFPLTEAELQKRATGDWLLIIACGMTLWLVNAVWLTIDTRPPVWDMALHQMYALNYVEYFAGPTNPAPRAKPPFEGGENVWELSGNYPPLVHLFIAATFGIFHPSPDIAALANLPATFLLFWSLLQLGRYFTSATAAAWACVLMLLTPYLMWMSRETILDYWLSAWVAAAWVGLIRTKGFKSVFWSRAFGFLCACGLLTKWLFAGFVAIPFLTIAVRHRIWKNEQRLTNALQAVTLAAAIPGLWYVPNLPHLFRYFSENAQVGALEGEPPVFSFQSLIYYLRLLEGYQLYGVLFLLLAAGLVFVISRRAFRDPWLWVACVAGGWLAMTLLRTKDPRFTMPLLPPLLLIPGAWVASWGAVRAGRAAQVLVVTILIVQAYAINFGISWLPQQVILLPGYQGSLRWDWQLFSQHYFGILGAPRREDWKQSEILDRIAEEARRRDAALSLALVPDLPRFDYFNFQLAAMLKKMPLRVRHLASAAGGLDAFRGCDFTIMSENEQGMPWTTHAAGSLNQFIVDRHDIFKLVGLYRLPNGDAVRLYFIDRGA
jgi:4-amino-4-deoxy-L-arabinose transferase-like glycosyltransferase